MAWDGNNANVNTQSYRNYMYGNSVFILDTITSDNCAYLIGDLTAYILNEQTNANPNPNKKLMFIINSPGGEVSVLKTFLGLINLAKLFNITVSTFVLGEAGSAASILAIQGNERYMTVLSKHFIHFGMMYDITQKRSEIEKIYQQNKEHAENIIDLYLEAGNNKLTKDIILQLQEDERGYLTADQCLKYGLCDFIVEKELNIKNKVLLDQLEFEREFNTWKRSQKTKNKEK